MIIDTPTQLDLIYIGWQNDFESADFALWADNHDVNIETGLMQVTDIVELLDKYYAHTKQKH